jgi:hypothetical protein
MFNIQEKMLRKQNEIYKILESHGFVEREKQDKLMEDLFRCLGVIK